MPSLWITALQQYNGTKGPWCIPRKGTKEYDEVKTIMEGKKTKAAKIEDKPEVKAVAKEMETKKAESAKTVETPKISSLPQSMRKSMNDKLSGMEETHEYKAGFGHPIDYINKQLSKYRGQDVFWGKDYDKARSFINAVEKYVKSKAIDATWRGESQKIILSSDWEKIF